MDKYYISDNCYYLNNKLYYENNIRNTEFKELESNEVESKEIETNKIESNEIKRIKINNRNWIKYLKDYGFTKLELNWRKKLIEKNNCNFGLLDCGSNGDCLFHVIAEGYNLHNIYNYLKNKNSENELKLYDIQDIRNIASKNITDSNFNLIIETYKCEDDFFGFWEPENIKNKEELQDEIRKTGDSFWGDHIILQLIQDYMKFNVIIFNSESYSIQNLACDMNKYEDTLIIYYLDGCHFQLIGYFNKDYIQTVFKKDELPSILNNLINNSNNI